MPSLVFLLIIHRLEDIRFVSIIGYIIPSMKFA